MNTVAAEWIKLRTLRSTWWVLGVGVLTALGLTALGASTVISRWDPGRTGEQAAMGIVVAVHVGVVLAQLPLGMLGTMSISGEYTSGMIHTTFVATPSRSRVLLAKASVLGGLAVAASLLIAIPGYLYGLTVASAFDPTLPPVEAWTVIGGGMLGIVTTTMLGLALGATFRNGVVATSVLVVVMVLVPFAGRMLPGGEVVNSILPGYPALQLVEQMPDIMPDAAAFAVLGFWAVVPLLVAILADQRVA
ncbi:ABC-2 type transport system permease protein [Nonomuraea maritima]|uniref:ABC-2 type transport system permease protein n=1 Tax=Nonomuraea maritima TaxID=683260 RepID=A0A1G9FGS8_9ACTN|nr:ABC transporter permease [Nonomuraea maritima]SDK87604.1 ABC-2 type transport system permease protein [Nonomuraea maritima]